jgi:L-amino acid N-acyltransferase YncA
LAIGAIALQFRVLEIRPARHADRDAIWEIFHEVVAAGDTYPFDPEMSREDALAYWFQSGAHTYVAEQDRNSVGEAVGFPGTLTASPTGRERERQIVGTYILRPNWSGPAGHVANAAFMVAPNARGRGIGRAMGEHCLSEARRLGFRAMQFNFVVSTNQSAIRLWQELGMKIIGTLPGAFRHPEKGYVDVHIMFRSLL